MRDSESSLRSLLDGGRGDFMSRHCVDLGPEFENAQLLAYVVQQDLSNDRSAVEIPPNACVANPQILALIDSGASNHMIGKSLLTPAERKTMYKVEPITYELATGKYTLDDAVDLWIPFVGDMLTFRVSDSTNSPMISEGRLCSENGFTSHRDAGSDILTLTSPKGDVVEVHTSNACNYVRFDAGLHTAAPFSEGGGESSGSGGPPTTPVADGGEGGDPPTPVPPEAEDPAVPTGPPDSGSVPPPPEPHPETAEARLRREARSRRHLMTHLPKNPYCPICQDSKTRAAPAKATPRRQGTQK